MIHSYLRLLCVTIKEWFLAIKTKHTNTHIHTSLKLLNISSSHYKNLKILFQCNIFYSKLTSQKLPTNTKTKSTIHFYCLYHKSLLMVIRACLSNVYLKITNMKEFHCHMNVAIILVTPLMLNHCKHNMTGKKSNVCNFFSTCVYLINSNLSTLADTETRKLH